MLARVARGGAHARAARSCSSRASASELRGAGLDLAGEPACACVGSLAREEFRALLRRARVFVCAPRREDYGIAQLEALADGCMLVTTPAPGPYAALPIARELDPRLVGDDLAARRCARRSTHPARLRGSARSRRSRRSRARRSTALVAEQLLPRACLR